MTTQCSYCFNEYKAKPNKINSGKTKYCSRFCKNLHKKTPEIRFWRYVTKGLDSECWIWKGSKNKDGYGKISNVTSAHRYSYQIHKGSIPFGLFIRHTCDNPSCVNPRHLITGTPAENSRDAVERGLYLKGEQNGNSKLSDYDAKSLKMMLICGWDVRKMAKLFGVSRGLAYQIKKGLIWKHV